MKNASTKATLLSSLGAGVEYYDFIIYGMMAEFLSLLFFTNDAPWLGALKAFAIFAVGYLVRPFGGIFFGMLADTFGRKKIFLYISLLMSVSTMAIGVLPTYQTMGVMASIALIVLRVFQGLSFGAELPGAITVACEYSEKKKEGRNASLVIASTSIGAVLASLVLYLLSESTTKGQILSWGWRIPFLLGGVFGLVNFLIRKHLQETPKFLEAQGSNLISKDFKVPLRLVVKNHWPQILQGIGMTSFFASSAMMMLYLPTYLTKHFSYTSSTVYLSILLSLLFSAIFLPICGYLADFCGKKNLLKYASLALIIGAFPLYALLEYQTFGALLLFMGIYQGFIGFASVSSLSLLVENFPTNVRYTGVAACYNLTFSLMSLLPLLLTALIEYSGDPLSVLWIVVACATLTFVCTFDGLFIKNFKKWAYHET